MKTSEYVSLGHPDKIADYISEYILDRLLEQDPDTRYALEVQIKDEHVTLGGEITTKAENIDYDKWVVEAIEQIGYTKEYFERWGQGNTINPEAITVTKHISQQSPDIAQGVNGGGWGDQGIMFGMAVDNVYTDYLPTDYYLAKKLGMALYEDAKNGDVWGLDIKTQVTTIDATISPTKPARRVIVAAPIRNSGDRDILRKRIIQILGNEPQQLIINGTGTFVKHASIGDCGTTGRKLAVDFYGGNCEIGGGSPWTKDGTKADLTLNMYARYLALRFVKKAVCEAPTIKVALSCCIGRNEIEISYITHEGQEIEYHDQKTVTPEQLIALFKLKEPGFAKRCEKGLFYEID